MSEWASTRPAVIDKLVTLAGTVVNKAAVEDGPTVTASGTQEAVKVGFDDEQRTDATQRFSFQNATVTPTNEDYLLTVEIRVVRGGGKARDARARAYVILAGLVRGLIEDHTLGGLVRMARPVEVRPAEAQTAKGVVATLHLAISIEATTTA